MSAHLHELVANIRVVLIALQVELPLGRVALPEARRVPHHQRELTPVEALYLLLVVRPYGAEDARSEDAAVGSMTYFYIVDVVFTDFYYLLLKYRCFQVSY